ncbi:ABC transporter permease [Clostridiaceae bacterium]|nr:ABC transporter permease [Clostridiaceae bacterium]RKI10214.1 ABC transporter permease [bacterium 1XD21-70]
MVRLLGDERRQPVAIPLFAIVLSLLAGAVVILFLGKNPLAAYQNLLQGSGLLPKPSYAGYKSMLTDFTSFMNAWTPMLFASLAVAVALRAGLFNIGVSGQMLTAGFIATLAVGYSSLAAPVAKPLVLVVGILAGAAVGGLIGWLKHQFNINEVVSSIMVNYIAQYVISFFINTYYVNPVSRQSNAVSKAARLTLMDTPVGNLKMDIPLGIVLAVVTAVAIRFVLNRTVFGYEVKCVGTSRNAARYAGIHVGRNMIASMVFSGGLAGLAGVTYYLGYFGSIQPRVLPSTGFDAIAVSLLANSNPVGIIFSSFLITIISKGSTYMNSSSGLESEIASVITGVILLFSACGAFIRYKVKGFQDELEEERGKG